MRNFQMRNLIQVVTDQHPSSLICKLASFCEVKHHENCLVVRHEIERIR